MVQSTAGQCRAVKRAPTYGTRSRERERESDGQSQSIVLSGGLVQSVDSFIGGASFSQSIVLSSSVPMPSDCL
eukprot:COSAG06_NODE_5668_length_3331_cov_2.904084_4_plen_73_part_00